MIRTRSASSQGPKRRGSGFRPSLASRGRAECSTVPTLAMQAPKSLKFEFFVYRREDSGSLSGKHMWENSLCFAPKNSGTLPLSSPY